MGSYKHNFELVYKNLNSNGHLGNLKCNFMSLQYFSRRSYENVSKKRCVSRMQMGLTNWINLKEICAIRWLKTGSTSSNVMKCLTVWTCQVKLRISRCPFYCSIRYLRYVDLRLFGGSVQFVGPHLSRVDHRKVSNEIWKTLAYYCG